MKTHKLISLILLFAYLTASSQSMNVRKWRKSERDSLDNGLYLIDENQYLQALPIFDKMRQNRPNEEFLRYTYAKCALYRSDKHADAYTYLSELYQKNKNVPDIQFDMAQACHYNYKFNESAQYLGQFLSNKRLSPEDKKKAEILRKNISNANWYTQRPTTAKIKLLPEINSAADESAPVITADDSKLIYTYSGD